MVYYKQLTNDLLIQFVKKICNDKSYNDTIVVHKDTYDALTRLKNINSYEK